MLRLCRLQITNAPRAQKTMSKAKMFLEKGEGAINFVAESPKNDEQMLKLFEQSELQHQYAVQRRMFLEKGEGNYKKF